MKKKTSLKKDKRYQFHNPKYKSKKRTKDYEWNSKCNLKRRRLSWSQEDDNTNYDNPNYKKKNVQKTLAQQHTPTERHF